MPVLLLVAFLLQEGAVAEDALWAQVASSPGANGRKNTWHSLFGIPPFEEGRVLAEGVVTARVSLELWDGDFNANVSGGESSWNNHVEHEALQIEYGLGDSLAVGARLAVGNVRGQGGEVTVFDGGVQIVDETKRVFDPQSLTLRVKYGDLWADQLDLAVLVEFKVPLDREHNLVTSDTLDASVTLLASRTISERFRMHVAFGGVLPIGDMEVFVADDEPGFFFTYALGCTWLASSVVSVYTQLEGNTSAFGEIEAVHHSVVSFAGGARMRLGSSFAVDATVGVGFDDASAETFIALGVSWLGRLN